MKIPCHSGSAFLRWSFANPPDETVRGYLHKYYRNYYENTEHIDYVWRAYDERLERLGAEARNGPRILEVGCGIGTNILFAALNGADCVGIDVKSADVVVARARQAHLESRLGARLKCRLEVGNIVDFDDADGFDVVFLQETFHHIEPREGAVEHLAQLTRRGGLLIFQEANAWNPFLQARLFRHRGLRTIANKRNPDTGETYAYGNERVLTAGQMTRLFRSHGFAARTRYFRTLPTALARNRRAAAIAGAIEKRFEKFPILLPFYLFYEWIGVKHG